MEANCTRKKVTAVVKIVSAACRYQDIIIPSPRHMDALSRDLITRILGLNAHHVVEQGFVDQWGRFYNRQHAWDVVQWNGQPFDLKRNGPAGTLYSEGLY
jgi:hypothetical protein